MGEYRTKEIILATKDKIGEIDKKLEHLKNLTCIDRDKKIKDIKYHIHCSKSLEHPELRYDIDWSNKSLKGMINNLCLRMGTNYLRNTGKVVRDNNGNSYLLSRYHNIYIPAQNQEGFKTTSNELLNDRFVNEFLRTHYFYPPADGINFSLHLYGDYIWINGEYDGASVCFVYYPGKAKAKLSTFAGDRLSAAMLKDMLNIPIDGEYINDYEKNFIDLSPETKKEINVPGFDVATRKVEFDVKENPKGLYLIRR